MQGFSKWMAIASVLCATILTTKVSAALIPVNADYIWHSDNLTDWVAVKPADNGNLPEWQATGLLVPNRSNPDAFKQVWFQVTYATTEQRNQQSGTVYGPATDIGASTSSDGYPQIDPNDPLVLVWGWQIIPQPDHETLPVPNPTQLAASGAVKLDVASICVPESATYGLVSVAGLLLLGVRQFTARPGKRV